MAWSLLFLEYLMTSNLKFKKATSKIEVFSSLPYLGWRLEVGGPQSKQGRDWKTSILIVVFRQHATVILKFGDMYLHNIV